VRCGSSFEKYSEGQGIQAAWHAVLVTSLAGERLIGVIVGRHKPSDIY